MKLQVNILTAIIIFSAISLSAGRVKEDPDINKLWNECNLKGIVSFNIFNTAIMGSRQIENLKKKNIVTIIDFSKPSTVERFLVIDLVNKKVLYKCLVAHGKNTGDNYAKNFSDKPGSLMSSLGFFRTAETYTGENGYSLRLDGLEAGINEKAREREIVIHGAAYVSREFIDKYGRIGRSWGCPALPKELSKEIIDCISGGSCLFIYADDKFYRENSAFLARK